MLVLSLFGMEAATIGSRFSYTSADGTQGAGIPPILPQFILPWNLPTGRQRICVQLGHHYRPDAGSVFDGNAGRD